MAESSIDLLQDFLNTVKRGVERIETNQYQDLKELHKTLKVMASICEKAADNVQTAMELN